MTGTLLKARPRDAIRSALLARFYAYQKGIDDSSPAIQRGDLQYLEGDALAVILAGAEQRAAGAVDAALADKAIGDSLRSHGRVLELVQGAGETPRDFGTRILAERRRRIGAGTPADWIAWAKQVDGISDAFWYSRLAPGTTTSTLGTGILLVVGPPQGQSVTNTRIPTLAVGNVPGYIDGGSDAFGNPTAGTELRPVTMPTDVGNVEINVCSVATQNIAFSVRVTPAFEFPWQPYAGLAVSSATLNTITVVGDYSALAGLPMLVFVGTTHARGGYVKAVPTTAVFGGVNTVFTFPSNFAVAPSGTIYPAPANWADLRDAVFAVFDALGPGDTTPARRYPAPDVSGDPVLRFNTLGLAIMGTKGVLSTTITTPGSSVTPAAKTLLELGTLTITRT